MLSLRTVGTGPSQDETARTCAWHHFASSRVRDWCQPDLGECGLGNPSVGAGAGGGGGGGGGGVVCVSLVVIGCVYVYKRVYI